MRLGAGGASQNPALLRLCTTPASPGPRGHPAHPAACTQRQRRGALESGRQVGSGLQIVCRRINKTDPGSTGQTPPLSSSKHSHSEEAPNLSRFLSLNIPPGPRGRAATRQGCLEYLLTGCLVLVQSAGRALLWAVSCWRHPSPGTNCKPRPAGGWAGQYELPSCPSGSKP